MKKKSESRIASVFSKILNIRKWSDLDRMKAFSSFVKTGFSRLFSAPWKNKDTQNKQQETPTSDEAALLQAFTDAQQKLNLNEEDLLNRQNALLRLSLLMSCFTVLILGYSLYHLFEGAFRASLVSLAVMSIAAALAFRYHFWYYQIKTKKLGCSVNEWLRKGLLGEKE